MNVSDFIHILQKENPVLSPQKIRELDAIIAEYPFFQAARALHLKGLKNLDSYQYHKTLKVTAAYTADREVLFHYINNGELAQHTIANTIATRIPKSGEQKPSSQATTSSQNLPNTEKPASSLQPQPEQDPPKAPSSKTSTPSDSALFTKRKRHSFMEWLQLTDTIAKETTAPTEEALDKKKRFALLDKFIKSNPKIVPREKTTLKSNPEDSSIINKKELMTETLANVYLEQKKYKKAIQAFTILRLKYPEKSGFFADRIRLAQQLQKEKE